MTTSSTRIMLSAIFVVFGIRTAAATLLQRFEIEDLALRAETVAIARVADVQQAWEDDGMIRTRVHLTFERVLAGRNASDPTVVIPGGRVGGFGATMGGAPTFEVGERVVVFLEQRRTGGMHVVGAFQGAFKVEREPETGMALVVREPMKGASFIDSDEDDGARRLYLDELEARVKAVRK